MNTDPTKLTVEGLMELAQCFASSWSLVGGQFDSGDMLDEANEAKRELESYACRLAATPPEPLDQPAGPAMWQARFFNTSGDPLGWGAWEELKPRGFQQTMEERLTEMRHYIAAGYKYELRALYAAALRSDPVAATPEPEVVAETWPQIKGVRVDGDKVIVAVKGGNEAARRLCGELLAVRTLLFELELYRAAATDPAVKAAIDAWGAPVAAIPASGDAAPKSSGHQVDAASPLPAAALGRITGDKS